MHVLLLKQNKCMLTARVPRPDKLQQFPAITTEVEFRNGNIYSDHSDEHGDSMKVCILYFTFRFVTST